MFPEKYSLSDFVLYVIFRRNTKRKEKSKKEILKKRTRLVRMKPPEIR